MNSLRHCAASQSLLSRLFKDKNTLAGVRFLYNEQFLGIDKYIEARQRTISRLGNIKGSFYNRMQTQINNPSPSMIFTEDLKTVIHSCEDKPEEIDICVNMLKRFHKQNKELRFGTFVFGPVAMRLFYYLQKKDIMLDFLKNPEFEGFFDQLKSYYLSMDIFFKNEMYQEIVEAFNEMQVKKIADTQFPREALVLVTGACYKLNTPETFRMATDLVTQAREARVAILRKALSFVIVLALKQNKPDVAHELLSSVDRFNNITGNNLKLMALAGLDRVQDAFTILRRVTDQDAPMQTRIQGEVCQGTLDALQQSVNRVNDEETSHVFEQMCRSLKESNSITSQTIDDLVCQPIEPRAFVRDMGESPFRQRIRFPEQDFRQKNRSFGDDQFSSRRKFAGLADSL